MKNMLDWEEIEETLFSKTKAAILRFAEEHPDEICSFFAFAWMIVDGDFSICLDTLSNAYSCARENEQDAIEQRRKMLDHDGSWKNAHYFLTDPRIVDYAPDIELFRYAFYADVLFEDWPALSESESYPKSQKWEDGYFEGNVQLVLWKVLERLIEEGVFSCLRLSSLFRVGYQFHDQELIVLRILNWPKVEETESTKQ